MNINKCKISLFVYTAIILICLSLHQHGCFISPYFPSFPAGINEKLELPIGMRVKSVVRPVHAQSCVLVSDIMWEVASFGLAKNVSLYFFHVDADYEFVGMGNRHIPTKCIALGKWDDPGM